MTVTLTGSLAEFSVSDVLNLLAMGGRTAAVRLTGPETNGSVWLVDGMVCAASADDSRASLLRALVAALDVGPADLDKALADPQPAQSLLDAQVVDGEAARLVAGEHCSDALGELLGWSGGRFEVHAGAVGFEDLGFRVAVDTCLAEARDRAEHWSELRFSLPDLESVLSLTSSLAGPPVLDLEDWSVLARVDGRRSVVSVLAALGTAPLAAGDRLVELLRRGLVTVTSAAGDEQRAAADALLAAYESGARANGSQTGSVQAPAADPPDGVPSAGSGWPTVGEFGEQGTELPIEEAAEQPTEHNVEQADGQAREQIDGQPRERTDQPTVEQAPERPDELPGTEWMPIYPGQWDAAEWSEQIPGAAGVDAAEWPLQADTSWHPAQAPAAMDLVGVSSAPDQSQMPWAQPQDAQETISAQSAGSPPTEGPESADPAGALDGDAAMSAATRGAPQPVLPPEPSADPNPASADFGSGGSLGVVDWDPEAWEGEPSVQWQGETWDSEPVGPEAPAAGLSGAPFVDVQPGSELAPDPLAARGALSYRDLASDDAQMGCQVSPGSSGSCHTDQLGFQDSPGPYDPSGFPGLPTYEAQGNYQDSAVFQGLADSQGLSTGQGLPPAVGHPEGDAAPEVPITWSPWAEALGLGIPEQGGPADGDALVGATVPSGAPGYPAEQFHAAYVREPSESEAPADDGLGADPLASGLLAELMSGLRGQ